MCGVDPEDCPYILQALKDARIRQSEFQFAYGLDGTLAHAVERVFGALAASRGEIYWRDPPAVRPQGIGRAAPLPGRPRAPHGSGPERAERLNWFICLNDFHDEYRQCAKAAVLSSERYQMNRFCLYDGADEPFADWLARHGVRVIRHRFSLVDQLLSAGIEGPGIAPGAYLRVDIPEVAASERLIDTSHYLYTDCDVFFTSDPSRLLDNRTGTFCDSAELSERDAHFNSGVMWCNAEFFRRSLSEFRRFLIEGRFRFVAYDQGALNEFYGSSRQVLGREYNWKPYWGVDGNAVIVHFHGPKPRAFRLWQRDPQEFARRLPSLTPFLGPHTRAAYEHYVGLFEQLLEREAAAAAST